MRRKRRQLRFAPSQDSPLRSLDWRRVGIAVLIALPLAVAGGLSTVVFLAQKHSPPTALRFWSTSPLAMNRLAAAHFAEQGESFDPEPVVRMARQSIAAQALNPEALRNAGLAYSLAGDPDSARTLFELVMQQSRRDTMTNIWMAEDALRKEEVYTGLSHLDRALRLEAGLQQTVFPILARTLSEPEARRALAPFLSRSPTWALHFVSYGLNDEKAILPLAQMVESEPQVERLFSSDRRRSLVRKLAERGELALAGALYRRWAEAQGGAIEGWGFDDGVDWVPFDWALGASGGLSVFQPRGQNKLEVTVAGSGTQRIAWRLLDLSPGVYRLKAKAEAEHGGLDKWDLRLSMHCAESAAPLGRLRWAAGTQNEQFTRITVPGGCSWQWLQIRSTGQRDANTILMSDLSIQPAT